MTLSKEKLAELAELEALAKAAQEREAAGIKGGVTVLPKVLLSLVAAARELEELRPYDELRRHGISVGGAQQAKHMAVAACEALGLDYDDTAPVDIADAILKLKSERGPKK